MRGSYVNCLEEGGVVYWLRPSQDTNQYLMGYQQQALDFAKANGVKLSILSRKHGVMSNWQDGQFRWLFKLRLSRGRKSYTFEYGQSLAAGSEEPTMYDVLSVLTKYDPGSFDDFCSDFGYNTGSRHAERVYKAVCKEWQAVERIFGDILDELREIQ